MDLCVRARGYDSQLLCEPQDVSPQWNSILLIFITILLSVYPKIRYVIKQTKYSRLEVFFK